MITKNVYVRTVMPKRKSCPACLKKLPTNEAIYSYGEYIRAKWNTFTYGCVNCFDTCAKPMMVKYKNETGREINIIGYQGAQIPEWLKLDSTQDKS